MVQFQKLADSHRDQAQKFKPGDAEESDDELGEDSVLLESPLDRIDPYLAFRDSFRSKCQQSSQRQEPFLTAPQNCNKNNPSSTLR